MVGFSWIHLSDWHQKGKEFDRKVVRDRLIKDIKDRSKISPHFEELDFIFFTGDVAYSGKEDEYEIAKTDFFDPILEATGLGVEKLFIIPGNHDLDLDDLDMVPKELSEKFNNHKVVNKWLLDRKRLNVLLSPMQNYSNFVKEYLGSFSSDNPLFGIERKINKKNFSISIIGLNSSWFTGRRIKQQDSQFIIEDYGNLLMGEAQVFDLIESSNFQKSDLRIVLMHHPFEWLRTYERRVIQEIIKKEAQIILQGHEHSPKVKIETGPCGQCVIIPAGPSYDRREPEYSECANSYNFGYIDLEEMQGGVFFRRYEDRQGWIKDINTTGEINDGKILIQISKPKRLESIEELSQQNKWVSNRFEKIINLYLGTCYERDQFAKLDQAGETDPDKTTLLQKVFIDLEVKTFGSKIPNDILKRDFNAYNIENIQLSDAPFSALNCILNELWPSIVFIGGPGQGKSTLSQFICQIHRYFILSKKTNFRFENDSDYEKLKYKPRIERIPFRIILKYFAQWISESPKIDTIEQYLLNEIEKTTTIKIDISELHEILVTKPILLILDGLDEVTDDHLRETILNRFAEFSKRCEQLDVDIQIIATSRPRGYSGQYSPEKFWHLELLPLEETKVIEYGKKWVEVKIQNNEEKKKVLSILKRCQKEGHTRNLLTTPLQVTIVLLIIKDGGTPPSKREALFQEYWNTIYKREKSKTTGIIKTDEALLFDLHSYFGYILHSKAENENLRSLLQKDKFLEYIIRFLKDRDSHSTDKEINTQATRIVKEASERLVLLVEPEPNYYGFELRSIQEFFAAAYLVQSAADTKQRFERMIAIAPSAHWRNVILFLSGRIIRNFGGEAANVLEFVCRPLNRDPYPKYLFLGSRLALDIASDGAFSSNRDLQYSTLELGLEILKSPLEHSEADYVLSSLIKLSDDEKENILKPIIEEKLAALPITCLPFACEAYLKIFGYSPIWAQHMDRIFNSGNGELICKAILMLIKNRVNIELLLSKINTFWSFITKENFILDSILSLYFLDENYFRDLFLKWNPKKDQILTFLKYTVDQNIYISPYSYSNIKIPKFDNLDQPYSQLLLVLKCLGNSRIICKQSEDKSRGKLTSGSLKTKICKSINSILKNGDYLFEETIVLLLLSYIFIADDLTLFPDISQNGLKISKKYLEVIESSTVVYFPILSRLVKKYFANEISIGLIKSYSKKNTNILIKDFNDQIIQHRNRLSVEEYVNLLFNILLGEYEIVPLPKEIKSIAGFDYLTALFSQINIDEELSKLEYEPTLDLIDSLLDRLLERKISNSEYLFFVLSRIFLSRSIIHKLIKGQYLKILEIIRDHGIMNIDLIKFLTSLYLLGAKKFLSNNKFMLSFLKMLAFNDKDIFQTTFYTSALLRDYGTIDFRLAINHNRDCLYDYLFKENPISLGAMILIKSIIDINRIFREFSISSRDGKFVPVNLFFNNLDYIWSLVEDPELSEFGLNLSYITDFINADKEFLDRLIVYLKKDITYYEIFYWSETLKFNKTINDCKNIEYFYEELLSQHQFYSSEIYFAVWLSYHRFHNLKSIKINDKKLGLPKIN